MKLFVGLATAVVMSLGLSYSGVAEALFLQSSLDKAKEVGGGVVKKVGDTANKAKDGVQGAVGAVGSAVPGAATAVGSRAKKLFEKATAAVVSLAKKVKVKAASFAKYLQQKGQYLFYEMLPGEFRRLQIKLLRKNSAGASGRAMGNSFSVVGAAPKTASTSLDPDGDTANPQVPTPIQKYAAWFNYSVGDAQPPKSGSRKGKQSLVKDQGMRGTCVAFATTAAMEAQISGPHLLSQEYVYWLLKDGDKSKICSEAEDGVTFDEAVKQLAGKGVPEEVHYVYLPWRGFDFAKLCPAGPSALAKKLANYKPKKIYAFPWRKSGKGATIANPRFIEAAIDAGYEIVSAFDVTFMQKHMGILGGWFYDATVDPDTAKATSAPGGHAMLIVGYERDGNADHGGGHIIVKNSWGALFGDGGYVKLSYDYVRQYAGDAYILEGVSN